MRLARVAEVCYPGVAVHEVLALENLWRERARATWRRAVVGYLRRWDLPDDVLRLIAAHCGCALRAVSLRRVPMRPGAYVVELQPIDATRHLTPAP